MTLGFDRQHSISLNSRMNRFRWVRINSMKWESLNVAQSGILIVFSLSITPHSSNTHTDRRCAAATVQAENVVLSHKTAPKLHAHQWFLGMNIQHRSSHTRAYRVSSAINLEFRCRHIYFVQNWHLHDHLPSVRLKCRDWLQCVLYTSICLLISIGL